MGSTKEGSTQGEEIATPDAIRLPNSPSPRPGETPLPRAATSRKLMPTSAGEVKSRWRSCTSNLRFVPWWSLLASALLVAGIVLFALKGKDAGQLSEDFLHMVGSDFTGFANFVSIFKSSWPATLGVAGGVVASSLLLAALRLNQKLRREGRTQKQGAWGKITFALLYWLCIVLLAFVVVVSAWLIVNLVFLTSWGLGLWAVRDGCSVAMQTMGMLAQSFLQYSGQLDDISKTLGGSADKLNGTMVNGSNLSALKTSLENMLAASNSSSLVWAPDGVCPSAACLNLNLYNYLESSSCACSQQLLMDMYNTADETNNNILYSLIAIGCMLLGSWVAMMQMAAGVKLMETDQLWLRVVRRRSSARMGEATPQRAIMPSPRTMGDTDKKVPLFPPGAFPPPLPGAAVRRLPYSSPLPPPGPPSVYNVQSDARA